MYRRQETALCHVLLPQLLEQRDRAVEERRQQPAYRRQQCKKGKVQQREGPDVVARADLARLYLRNQRQGSFYELTAGSLCTVAPVSGRIMALYLTLEPSHDLPCM